MQNSDEPLKACHAESTQDQTRRLNAIESISADLWTSIILPNLDNPSVLAFSRVYKFFNRCSKQTLSSRKNRKDLVNLVLANNLSEVQQLLDACATNDTIRYRLAPGLLRPYQGCIREHSPFYIAAMDRNKPMFDLLTSRLPQQNHTLCELVYLVISNQGEMQGEEWQFDVETYLQNNNPYLIFEPGPDGLSPLQIAAADKDIHMLLALLKPLTNNPGKLEESRAEAYNELTLEEKWNMCVHALLKDLPSEVQSTTLRQLQAVRVNGWLIDAARYTEAYRIVSALYDETWLAKVFDNSVSDENETRLAIGKRQRTMPLHARADIYFHSYGSNDPLAGATPSYYERCGSRVFRLGNSDLFARLYGHGALGVSCSLVRDQESSAGPVWGHVAGRCTVDSVALTRHFEVRTQQLDIIVNTLQLLQQEVNNIVVVQQTPSMP